MNRGVKSLFAGMEIGYIYTQRIFDVLAMPEVSFAAAANF
jgi:hypothetical protein